jgi:hypothetical protein
MSIRESCKFTNAEFSGKRVGYVLAITSFALVPAHFYVSSEASGAIFGTSMVLLLATGVLSFIVARDTGHRFRPLAWAFLAMITNGLCTHGL